MRCERTAALSMAIVMALGAPARADEARADEVPLDRLPVLIAQVEAVYPPEALAAGVSMDILLELDISAEGKVEAARVREPERDEYGFGAAAVAAAALFAFAPATAGGVPVPVTIELRYRFVLPEKPEPTELEAGAEPARRRSVSLSGELLERGTRRPLAGVRVTAVRSLPGGGQVGYEATTDASGRFSFFDLEPGAWEVAAEPEGHLPLRSTDEIRAGEVTEVRYYLEKTDYNPFDVLVETTRAVKEVSRTSIAATQAERVPGTFGDVLGVVQNLPGVARSPGAGPAYGSVIVRGSAPEDTGVFVSGVQVPIIYHFGGLRSVIPSQMLERLDFLPGNFSSEFGNVSGGIIDVRLKELRPPRLGAIVDVNLLDAALYAEAPITDELAVAIGARRSYVDAVLGAVLPEDAPLSFATAPRYYDGQLLVAWTPDPAHQLRAFLFGSDDELALLFDNPANTDAQNRSPQLNIGTRFYRTILGYRYVPSEDFENSLTVAAGRNWITFDRGRNLAFDLEFYLATLKDVVRWRPSEWTAVRGGLELLYYETDIALSLPPPSKEGEARRNTDLDLLRSASLEDVLSGQVGLFVEAELSPFDGLSLVPGVRSDWLSQLGKPTFGPRLPVRYTPTDALTLKAGTGIYHQAPQFEETSEAFGNPDLGAEWAIHGSVGAELRPLDFLTFDATLYYKDLRDLVGRSGEIIVRDGVPTRKNYDNGALGRVFGLELLAKHDLANDLSGWISYSLSRAERRDSGSSTWRLFDYDQTHVLTAVLAYRLPWGFEISGRFRFASGNPYTPIVGATLSSDDDRYDPIPGAPNTARLDPFHQLDIRLDKRWVLDSWLLSAYVDVQNIYNRKNPELIMYNFDYSQLTYSSGLPIFAMLGVRAEL